jgi:V8-like Glu-specific endopeptidase
MIFVLPALPLRNRISKTSFCGAFYVSFCGLIFVSGCRLNENKNSMSMDTRRCPSSGSQASAVRAKLSSAVQPKNKGMNLVMPEAATPAPAGSASAPETNGSENSGATAVPVSGSPSSSASLPAAGSEGSPSAISVDDLKSATVALTFKLINSEKEVSRGICTGVIAGKNYILTAAHCFAPPSGKPVGEFSGNVIVAPKVDYNTSGRAMFEVESVAVHPDWNGLHHDIAIVFIKKNFPDELKAVSVAGKVFETAQNTPVVLVGYGISGDDKTDAGTSRHGESMVHSLINQANYPDTKIENQIRIKGSPQTSAGACTGDSGGPAFLKNSGLLLGLVSGMNLTIQNNLDCKNRDSNYTLVEPYLGWIESITGHKPSTGDQFTSLKDLVLAQMSTKAVSPVGMTIKPPEQTVPAPKNVASADAELKQKQGKMKTGDEPEGEGDPCVAR